MTVIGFRSWVLDDDGGLQPPFRHGTAWSAPFTTAECPVAPVPAHGPAPAGDCKCGLYATHDRPARISPKHVLGAIQAWGHVEVHLSGFRAQHARPVALVLPPDASPYERRLIEQAARRYDAVLVTSADDLETVASEWGSTVALADRPFTLLSTTARVPSTASPATHTSPNRALLSLLQRTREAIGDTVDAAELEQMTTADVAAELLAVCTPAERGLEPSTSRPVRLTTRERHAILRDAVGLDPHTFDAFWRALSDPEDERLARELVDAGCRAPLVVTRALGRPETPPHADSWRALTARRLVAEVDDCRTLQSFVLGMPGPVASDLVERAFRAGSTQRGVAILERAGDATAALAQRLADDESLADDLRADAVIAARDPDRALDLVTRHPTLLAFRRDLAELLGLDACARIAARYLSHRDNDAMLGLRLAHQHLPHFERPALIESLRHEPPVPAAAPTPAKAGISRGLIECSLTVSLQGSGHATASLVQQVLELSTPRRQAAAEELWDCSAEIEPAAALLLLRDAHPRDGVIARTHLRTQTADFDDWSTHRTAAALTWLGAADPVARESARRLFDDDDAPTILRVCAARIQRP